MQRTMEPPLIAYFSLLRKQRNARTLVLVSDDASLRRYIPNGERESEGRQSQSSLNNEKDILSPKLRSLETNQARRKSVGHPTMTKRDPRWLDALCIHHPDLSGSDDDEPPLQPTRVASNENLLLKSSRWRERQNHSKAASPSTSVGRAKKGSDVLKKFFDEVTPTSTGGQPKSRSSQKSACAPMLSKERPALSRQQNLAPLKPPLRKKSADDLVTSSSHGSSSWSVTNSSSSSSSNARFEQVNQGRKRKEPKWHHKRQTSPNRSQTTPGQPRLPSSTVMLGMTECFVDGFSDQDVEKLNERKRSSMGNISIPQRSNSDIVCRTVVPPEA